MYIDEIQGVYEISKEAIKQANGFEHCGLYIVTFGEYRNVWLSNEETDRHQVPITFIVHDTMRAMILWGHKELFQDMPFCSCLR